MRQITTEAGKRLIDRLESVVPQPAWREEIAAIEAEARAMTGVEAVNLRVRVIEERAVAAERARLAQAVRALYASEWRDCPGNCHDYTLAAVLALLEPTDG